MLQTLYKAAKFKSEILNIELLVRLLNMLFGFVFGLLLTRFLSVESRGVYALFINYSIINSIILSFGYPDFLLKYSSQINIVSSLKKYLFVFITLLIVIGIFNFFLLKELFFSIIVFSVLQLVALLLRYYFYISHSIKYGEFFQLSISIVNIVAVGCIYLFSSKSLNYTETWVNISITVIFIVIALFLFLNEFFRVRFKYPDIKTTEIKFFLKRIFSFGVVSISGILIGKAIYYYLLSYNNIDLVAKYSVSEIITSVLVTFFSVITVKYSISIYDSKINGKAALIKFLYVVLFVSLPAIIILYFFGGSLFSIVYGESYRTAGNIAFMQVIIASLSSISSFLVVLNISIGLIYQNSYMALVVLFILFLFRLYIDQLSLNMLYAIVITLNFSSIIFLFLLNYFCKVDKHEQ
jgi:O-antigen/teichoic acid export membrane protein